jgi:hypothetical protein
MAFCRAARRGHCRWPLLESLPNQRMKLTARGGRLIMKRSVLVAAAAGRSLCAIR